MPSDALAQLWLAELGIGVFLPALLWAWPALRRSSLIQWAVPLLMLAGVLMNRFDATVFAQILPRAGASYSPHILEWVSTAGILAGVALVWYLGVLFLDSHSD